MKKKIGIVSLGCPKNLVDTEVMLGHLKREGYEITGNKNDAEIIIVNTCGFIDSAKRESIDTILEMAALKKEKLKLLIVAGCLAERYSKDIMKELPEVDAVVGTGAYGDIAKVIEESGLGGKPVYSAKRYGLEYLDEERILSTGKGYAYLKIAEGCSNCCTYCVIPSLRGPYRSRSMESLMKEARGLASGGVKELILVAQDTSRYGIDLYGRRMISELVNNLSEVEGIEWIRLLYCYPDEIDDEFIKMFKTNEKVCKYLDLPIQHVSDSILKAMGRRGTGEDIKGLINRLRKEVPDIYVRTSIIVGFPGETEEDFEALREFLEEYKLDRVGVFTYSKEEGTPAARMKFQVPQRVKKARYKALMEQQKDISAVKNRARIGKIYKTLVEGVSEDGIFYKGRTYAEAPDIDGNVYLASPVPLEEGGFVNIKVLDADEYDITGEVI